MNLRFYFLKVYIHAIHLTAAPSGARAKMEKSSTGSVFRASLAWRG
jgi:hypothetical protein